ncbi:transmembrane protein, putative (macronuclear) [Tetrahymena thermophila SB210]|uniref:Transmembrane protein, putative n=1 Tax=Tetrahymena thermophila (strain SB210) TaxID=312017 RepID=I7LY13_TETTS|nr:transmembrane protein, putative [Tetrahymena thermophila SB210]EAS07162.1 transmembrane protein, putative [Tetrahymena thermophila SB210]|eukprot:XP_001027404.1 transmembrane protein, putative [Tetrahymena thermophila SB210]
MTFNKKIISAVLALQIIFCFASCKDLISLDLKLGEYQQLYITTKYGQCEINVIPNLGYCSNSLQISPIKALECGAKLIGENLFVGGSQYSAKFQLGQVETNLSFTIPNTDSAFFGEENLCFGEFVISIQDNIIVELFSQRVIQDQKFYVNIKDIKSLDKVVGSIELGAPNKSLIKKGSNFVSLLSNQGEYSTDYYLYSNRNLSYGNLQLFGGTSALVSLGNPFLCISNFGFESLLQAFSVQGIKYTYLPDENYQVVLESIDKLQNISIDLVKEDNSIFTLTVKPEHYTRQLENGQYELLIQPTFYTNVIALGYTILQPYYLGFDVIAKTVLIAEKAEDNVVSY